MTALKLMAMRWFWPLGFGIAGLAPLITDGYTQYILNLVFVYIVVSIGLNFIIGFAGLFAFSHAAFMGIGAYTVALLATRVDVPFLLAIPIGGLAAGAVGCLVGIPALRVSGLYLAMVTMAFGELLQWILTHWKEVTRGVDGITVPAAKLFGWTIRSDNEVYYVILVVVFVMILLAKRILESKLGRAFVAVRESETVAMCNGINVARTKTIAFGLSAFYAGIGGALLALTLHYIAPNGFGLIQTILHFCIVVIGGIGSLAGSIIGALLLTILPEVLREAQQLQEIAYGFLLVAFVIFAPRGIAGFLRTYGCLPREILVSGWRERVGAKRSGRRSGIEQ